jgi:hypothetical protein
MPNKREYRSERRIPEAIDDMTLIGVIAFIVFIVGAGIYVLVINLHPNAHYETHAREVWPAIVVVCGVIFAVVVALASKLFRGGHTGKPL